MVETEFKIKYNTRKIKHVSMLLLWCHPRVHCTYMSMHKNATQLSVFMSAQELLCMIPQKKESSLCEDISNAAVHKNKNISTWRRSAVSSSCWNYVCSSCLRWIDELALTFRQINEQEGYKEDWAFCQRFYFTFYTTRQFLRSAAEKEALIWMYSCLGEIDTKNV